MTASFQQQSCSVVEIHGNGYATIQYGGITRTVHQSRIIID